MNKNSKDIRVVSRISSIVCWCIGTIFLFIGEQDVAVVVTDIKLIRFES